LYDFRRRSRCTGKERDAETSLDYFGARYMSSAQGRFTSVDQGPWELTNPQSFNGYGYGLNSPLRYADEEGESATDRVNLASDLATQSIPYVRGGTTCSGFDCSGFVAYVFNNDPDKGIHLSGNVSSEMAEFQNSGQYSSDIGEAQPGDAIFFVNPDGTPAHTGLVISVVDGKIYMVHAPRPGKVVSAITYPISTKNGQFGAERAVGVGRPRQLATTSQRPTTRSTAQPTTLMDRFTQWWNSWSLFPKTEDVHSTVKYPKAKKKKTASD